IFTLVLAALVSVIGAILANCKALTHLEIHGCLNVKLETEFGGQDEQDDGDAEYSSSDSEWKILFLHPG
ncbi:hypothetical protein Gohar_005763, partial [Gossypium harknessii]|nr:hypothetical protein [Gossypium harknessii]